MTFSQILYDVENKICTITLNRLEKMNAWTATMKDELISAFDMADKDDVKEGIASFFEKRPPKFPLKAAADMSDFYPWWEERTYDQGE